MVHGHSNKAKSMTFSESRNAPVAISSRYHLARSHVERFDLYSAMDEYRAALVKGHRQNLNGALVAPPRAEDLRKNPMAAVPKTQRPKSAVSRASSSPPGTFMRMPMGTVHVTAPGSHLFEESYRALPLHMTYH
eukprot:TRINITY_DN29796_c0_g1_i1.p1 TRINITY_DN29796_c0_g1~~TRINITY_DN29796_c0_g1_i1.p1  ORF type:complete len:134 (+),score=11.67 TRINITY_DN29796_c0_g1_i1:205-606(+)